MARSIRPLLTILAGVLPLALAGCLSIDMPASRTPPPTVSGSGGSGAPTERSSAVFVNANSVRVGKGDTVYAISRRHEVPVRAIIEANGLTPPYVLLIGQWLKLPRAKVHMVVRGDTLYSISRRYDVDVSELARLNAIGPPYSIAVGQRLVLPGQTEAVMAAPSRKPEPSAPSSSASPAPKPSQTVVAPSRPKAVAAIPTPPARSSGTFLWPVKGKILSSYGDKGKGLHNDGVNIAAPRGTQVAAAENGVVAYAGNELKGFGNLLLIKHDGGWITAYAHNDELLVKRGDRVRKGQTISKVGSTGSVTTPQLHFEIRKGKKAVDPARHLGA